MILKLTYGQFENAKIKVKNAKLRYPDFVGIPVAEIAVFIMVLFSIIMYHIMGYIGSRQ